MCFKLLNEATEPETWAQAVNDHLEVEDLIEKTNARLAYVRSLLLPVHRQKLMARKLGVLGVCSECETPFTEKNWSTAEVVVTLCHVRGCFKCTTAGDSSTQCATAGATRPPPVR